MIVQTKRQVRELHTETDLQPEQIASGASTPRFNARENICKTLGNIESKDMQDEEIASKLEFMQTFGLNKEGRSLLECQGQDLRCVEEQDQLQQQEQGHTQQQSAPGTDKKKKKLAEKQQYEIDWTQEGMFQFPTILASTDSHAESAESFSSPMFFQKRNERQKQSYPEFISEKTNSIGVIPSATALTNGSKKGTRRIKLTPQAFNNAISKDIPGIALPKARVPSRGGSIIRTSIEDASQLKSQESRKPSQSYHVSSSSLSYLPKKNPQALNLVEDFSSRRVSTEGPLKIAQSRPRWQSTHDSTQLYLQISPQLPQSAVSQSNFSSSQPISPLLCSQLLSPLFYAPSCVVSQSQSQKNSLKQSRAETPPHHIIFPKKKNSIVQEQLNKEGFNSNNNPTPNNNSNSNNNNRLLEVKLNNFQSQSSSSSTSKSHSLPSKKQSLFPLLTEPAEGYNYDTMQSQQLQYEQYYLSKQKEYYYQQMMQSSQLNQNQSQSISPQKQPSLGLSKQTSNPVASASSKQGQQQSHIQQQQLQSNMNLQSLVINQQQQIQQQQIIKLSQSTKKTTQQETPQQSQQRLSQKSIKQQPQYLQNPLTMLQPSHQQVFESAAGSSKQLYNYHTLDQATSKVPSSSLSPKKNKSITITSSTVISSNNTATTTNHTNNPNSMHLLPSNSSIPSNNNNTKNIRKNQNSISSIGNTTLTILNDKPLVSNTAITKKQVIPSNDIISTRKHSKELLDNSGKKENSKKILSNNNNSSNINTNYYTSNNTNNSKHDLSSFETQASSISPQDVGSKGFTWKRRESSDLTHLQKAQARLISKKPNFDELTQKLLSALRTLLEQLKGSSNWVIQSIIEQQKYQQPLWNMIVLGNSNKKHSSNHNNNSNKGNNNIYQDKSKHANQQQQQYQLCNDSDIQFQPSEHIEAALNELLASSLNKSLTVQTLLTQTTHLKLHISAAACSTSSYLGNNVSSTNTQVI